MNLDRGPPFTREEVENAGDNFPSRGLYCTKCKGFVPIFAALSSADHHRIRSLALANRSALAMAELRDVTGCGERWAKIWVIHAGRPTIVSPGPPCPHCGKPLATERAQQCLHCHADWHGR
jgi:hypothetical protein